MGKTASYTMGSSKLLLVVFAAAAAAVIGLAGASFRDECDIPWEPQNARFTDDGSGLSLSLVSNYSGTYNYNLKYLLQLINSRTKKQFIFGSVSTLIQLVPGNSAGTVTTYYTSSVGDNHDEIDFEFLGNETGQPYTIHTNIYANGKGDKEMQFKPWFNPTDGYHNYTVSWTPCMIVWYIDGTPIRVFRNYEENNGVAFPTKRPMYGYSSIWAAEDWATQGGRVKADWSKAPFVANYRGLNVNVCECSTNDCATQCASAFSSGSSACQLSDSELAQMRKVQDEYMIYNYCVDFKRYNGSVPVECSLSQQ
uniref:Xyloglucan endotransglucosylase/hydrolase n=1 Tax=Leersia perrieri TaxID=77586 RepID=A0A0D9VET9_9ORYZ